MNKKPIALLVEDDLNMAESFGEILAGLGHAHVHVRSREDALWLLGKGQFCYVLTDLSILDRPSSLRAREEAGFAVIEAARAKYPGRTASGEHTVPIILVTGHGGDRETVKEAKQRGADAVLRKPLSENKPSLQAVITDLLLRGGKACHSACGAVSHHPGIGAHQDGGRTD